MFIVGVRQIKIMADTLDYRNKFVINNRLIQSHKIPTKNIYLCIIIKHNLEKNLFLNARAIQQKGKEILKIN